MTSGDLLFQEWPARATDIKEGTDWQGRKDTTRIHPEGEAEQKNGKKPMQERVSSPPLGGVHSCSDPDKEGREASSSSDQDAEAGIASEDEEHWFEDWWMPPVNASEPATTPESCD
ncbi:hypothetical protein NDU88_009492 [Pleurodeles waltl]|uniref:Uncharacterized protein n=1 Tax=Pleurodeles waltl TaxID=8319 RepID=A0AAV7RZ64_PLEWA|nr:hypothetical protein NDU88_009492 [Pleurodeles waltl]